MLTNLLIALVIAWIVIRTVRRLVANALKAGAHKLEEGLEKGAREGARRAKQAVGHARERVAERREAAQRSWTEIEREAEALLPPEIAAAGAGAAGAAWELLAPEPIEAPAEVPAPTIASPTEATGGGSPAIHTPAQHAGRREPAQHAEGREPAPPAPEPARPRPTLERELSPDVLRERLFADSAPGFEVARRFQEEFRGRRVRWSGELDRAARGLGARARVQVTVETSATPLAPIARPLRWTFALEPEAGADLVGQRKLPLTVEGTLEAVDPYLLQFTLADVEPAS